MDPRNDWWTKKRRSKTEQRERDRECTHRENIRRLRESEEKRKGAHEQVRGRQEGRVKEMVTERDRETVREEPSRCARGEKERGVETWRHRDNISREGEREREPCTRRPR
jgi:hypothetical protein